MATQHTLCSPIHGFSIRSAGLIWWQLLLRAECSVWYSIMSCQHEYDWVSCACMTTRLFRCWQIRVGSIEHSHTIQVITGTVS